MKLPVTINKTLSPLTNGMISQTVSFNGNVFSNEITVPRKPPTMINPCCPARFEAGIFHPILANPPIIPLTNARIIQGAIKGYRDLFFMT